LVTIDNYIDVDAFKENLAKWGGKAAAIASEASYPADGSTQGDAALAQQQAPTIVQRMKDAGVTTVLNFTDMAMTIAMMNAATQQNWFPEWYFTGAGYLDLGVIAQAFPDDQAEHGFGITTSGYSFNAGNWLLAGIHYAGPNLSPNTWRQGLFSA